MLRFSPPLTLALKVIAAVLLWACQRDPSEQKVVARDLTRQLSPSATAVDTAAQRADSQFQTCLYVYDTEERLRECLVLKNRWPTQDAARAFENGPYPRAGLVYLTRQSCSIYSKRGNRFSRFEELVILDGEVVGHRR